MGNSLRIRMKAEEIGNNANRLLDVLGVCENLLCLERDNFYKNLFESKRRYV